MSPSRLFKSETKKTPLIHINANMFGADQASDEEEGDFARELKKRVFSARQRMVNRPCCHCHKAAETLEVAPKPKIFERAHAIPTKRWAI